MPHRPELPVVTAWDLGIADATAVIYVQEVGEWWHVIRAEEFVGLGLPEILSRVRAHGDNFGAHVAPHDIEVRDYSGDGTTRREVARRVGVDFDVAPRLSPAEGIDAVRRLFPRLKFDRRGCARLLQALGEYSKVWDARGKTFRDAPLHSWASHLADALRTLATGFHGSAPLVAQEITVVSSFDPRMQLGGGRGW